MTRSDFEFGFDDNVLWLIDLNQGNRSLTNDIENALNTIIDLHDLEFVTSRNIIYRDSDEIWDGVTIDKINNGKVIDASFYTLNEIDLEKAKAKLLNPK